LTSPLKILHLEDMASDAEFVERELHKGNIHFEKLVVGNRSDFEKALKDFKPEIIISDHSLPSFNSIEALAIVKASGAAIPFILVTATMSEEFAVSIIQEGADDYILKNNLTRLPSAITRAIDKKCAQESKAQLEKTLSEEKTKKHHEITDAVLTAQEQERFFLGQELHDNINQILATSKLYLDVAIADDAIRKDILISSKDYVVLAMEEIRKLSQSLLPPSLGEISLSDALNNLIQNIQPVHKYHFITEWENLDESVLSEKLSLTIFRIVQEQLNNIFKHAQAKTIIIGLKQEAMILQLKIKDDGIGFDTTQKKNGVGLKSITSRALFFNGNVIINSEPGKGCEMIVSFNMQDVV
jgi:signal transduction histidine kinase